MGGPNSNDKASFWPNLMKRKGVATNWPNKKARKGVQSERRGGLL